MADRRIVPASVRQSVGVNNSRGSAAVTARAADAADAAPAAARLRPSPPPPEPVPVPAVVPSLLPPPPELFSLWAWSVPRTASIARSSTAPSFTSTRTQEAFSTAIPPEESPPPPPVVVVATPFPFAFLLTTSALMLVATCCRSSSLDDARGVVWRMAHGDVAALRAAAARARLDTSTPVKRFASPRNSPPLSPRPHPSSSTSSHCCCCFCCGDGEGRSGGTKIPPVTL